MRSKLKPYPQDGDLRRRRAFLWWPKAIGRDRRWLEWAEWAEVRYVPRLISPYGPLSEWRAVAWIDETRSRRFVPQEYNPRSEHHG